MEENSDRYVLVLEDRSETKSPADLGRLSVISGQDEKGKIKTVEPTEENRSAFFGVQEKRWAAEKLYDEPPSAVQ